MDSELEPLPWENKFEILKLYSKHKQFSRFQGFFSKQAEAIGNLENMVNICKRANPCCHLEKRSIIIKQKARGNEKGKYKNQYQ